MRIYQKLIRLLLIVLPAALVLEIVSVTIASSVSNAAPVPRLGVTGTVDVQPAAPASPGEANALNPNPPGEVVKLVFIHHSCGAGWLNDGNGGLGAALGENNYYVSDTYYGWGPADADLGYETIGDHTDIGHWYNWFAGPNRDTYLGALYTTTSRYASYTRPMANPGGENQIVMFKSCYPNSNLRGDPDEPPTSGDNPLRGVGSWSGDHTVGNAKGIYNDILEYFRTRQDKLFVVITAPPVMDGTYADNARAFNNWLVYDWLADYPHHNVAVFDLYNVLTTNGGDANTNDYGWSTGNHHRVVTGTAPITVEHITDGDDDASPNVLEYPTGGGTNDHPSFAGNQKATGEFVPLLNVYYNCWKHGDCGPGELRPQAYLPIVLKQCASSHLSRIKPASGGSLSFGSPMPVVASGGNTSVVLPVDLDRDGRVDIAYGEGSVLQIARNTTRLNGTWPTTRSVGTAVGEITSLATGDLNRDGRPDLVTASDTEIRLWGNPGTAFSQTWIVGAVLTEPVGVEQHAVALADLDRDGALDVVAGGADGVVRLWHNPSALQGDLTNTWSTVKELPALSGSVTDVEVGDMDRDGQPDLIVTSDGVSPAVRLWRNPGAAFCADWVETVDLLSAGELSLPAGQRLVVADLDGDNWLDVAVGDQGGTLYAWHNPGTPPFGEGWAVGLALASAEGDLRCLIGVDLDNDAILELVGVVGNTSTEAVVWENDGGAFGSTWTTIPIGAWQGALLSVQSADLDGDGDPDVMVSGQGGISALPNWLTPWTVGFVDTEHTVGVNDTWTTDMVVADLDRDGDLDLVTGELDGRIMAWRNDGTPFDGGWAGSEVGEVTSWWDLLALAAGDLDNDGDLDLVTGYYYKYGPTIWENDGSPFDGQWSWRQIGDHRVGTGGYRWGWTSGRCRRRWTSLERSAERRQPGYGVARTRGTIQ
jgi:hypothetical protein